MKYAKPNEAIEGLRFHCRNDSPTSQGLALLKWIDSLPDSFEIVPEGHVCVKWPEGLTRETLLAYANEEWATMEVRWSALRALAAIAPERPKKRKVYLFKRDLPHWREKMWSELDSVEGWTRVGECEIEE